LIVAVDSNSLVTWSSPRAGDGMNRARLEFLFDEVAAASGRIVIPAPVFAEFLVGIDESASEWINVLDNKRGLIVAPFDKRAAFDCSLLDKAALGRGDKKGGRDDRPWQRVKVDRQIVAIAKVNNVDLLITNDGGLRETATTAGLTVKRIEELPVPQSVLQGKLFEPTSKAARELPQQPGPYEGP
jgi:hypothetical protein